MLTNAPIGSIGAANQSGWMTVEMFLVYMDHIQKRTKCLPKDLVLLLPDNHVSDYLLKP